MEHDGPNGKRVSRRDKTAELVWKFTKVGEFEDGLHGWTSLD